MLPGSDRGSTHDGANAVRPELMSFFKQFLLAIAAFLVAPIATPFLEAYAPALQKEVVVRLLITAASGALWLNSVVQTYRNLGGTRRSVGPPRLG